MSAKPRLAAVLDLRREREPHPAIVRALRHDDQSGLSLDKFELFWLALAAEVERDFVANAADRQ